MLIYATTRFEQGRERDARRFEAFAVNFRAMAAMPGSSVLANNLYDSHCEQPPPRIAAALSDFERAPPAYPPTSPLRRYEQTFATTLACTPSTHRASAATLARGTRGEPTTQGGCKASPCWASDLCAA